MTHDPNVLHTAIRQQQPMFNIKSLPTPNCLIEGFLHTNSVLRMGSLQYSFQRRFAGRIVAKNSKCFIRPDDIPGRNVPAEAPGVADSLRLREIGLAS